MEASLLAEAFKGLVAAGPVAMVLGLFCWVLWKQNTALLRKLDRQHDKMLKLAVRVQRAVEVLAGVEHEHTEVEDVLAEEAQEDEQAKKRDQKDIE
jgi:hypothetical protein